MRARLFSRVTVALAGLMVAANVALVQADDGASNGGSTPAHQEHALELAALTTSAVLPEEPARGEPPRRRGPGQGRRPAQGEASELWGAPLANNDGEKKALAVLEAMKSDRDLQFRNVSEQDGRLMRQLTEAIGAKRVVEIGTSTGYSGIWFALALRSTGGKLITHEIDEGRAATAREQFKKAGVDDLITVIVGNAHEKVKELKEPIDVIFLDADKEGYIDYLEKLLPLLRPGGLVMAHNMRMPRADPRYVKAITENPELETTFLLMDGAGLGVTMKKR